MLKNVYELTNEGVEKLKQELDYLIDVARPQNVEAIKEARAQGDLSENADYDAARNEQARIEGRIVEIQNILKNVKIIEESKDVSRVTLGKNVKVVFTEMDNMEKTYRIVGTIEANPFEGKISKESPLGKTLLGKKIGTSHEFTSEVGKEIKVKIIAID